MEGHSGAKMRSEPYSRVVGEIERLVVRDESDGECLRRFVTQSDEQAFALLVRRHGPMVFGVCQRLLQQQQDAEDAFQAVFMVLARKASSVKPMEAVGRWLYGVAVRVALKVRGKQQQRANREHQLTHDVPSDCAPACDWLPLLDQALSRLSERDRQPVLLCDLFGRSRTEAAAELGIPEGTLSSRLARSREKLRQHLVRLGVAPSVAVLAGALGQWGTARVPAHLATLTPATIVRPTVKQLADGVIQTMVMHKLYHYVAVIGCLLMTLGIGWQFVPTVGADPTKSPEKSRAVAAAKTPDHERIQGTWIVDKVGVNGKTATIEDHPAIGMRMIFTDQRVEYSLLPGRHKSFTLDESTTPKQINFEFRPSAANRTGQIQHLAGIYRFAGDQLHLTLGIVDFDERPTSFDWSEDRPAYMHLTLRRLSLDESKELTANQKNALRGSWAVIGEEKNGQYRNLLPDTAIVGERLTAAMLEQLPRVVVQEQSWRMRYPNIERGDEVTFTFAINPNPAPRHLTLRPTKERPAPWTNKDGAMAAIYDYHRSILRIGLPDHDTYFERPTTWDTTGNKHVIYYLVSADEPLPPRPPIEPKPEQNNEQAKRTGIEGLWTGVAKEVDGKRTDFTESLVPRMVVQPNGIAFHRSSLDPLYFGYKAVDGKLDLIVAHDQRDTTTDGLHRVFLRDQEWPGLYEIKGDELRLSLSPRPGGARPTSLDSQRSQGEVLIFRRDPADADLLLNRAWRVIEAEIDPIAVVAEGKNDRFGRGRQLAMEHFGGQSVGGFGAPPMMGSYESGMLRFDGVHVRLKSQMAYRLRTDSKLKEIDLICTSGSELGQRGDVIKGIYQLSGNELTLCFPRLVTSPRPTSFTVKGTAYIKVTLQVIEPKASPKAGPAKTSRTQELKEERTKVLQELRALYAERVNAGQMAVSELFELDAELHTAALASAKTPAQRVTVCEANVKRMLEHEKLIAIQVKAGTASLTEATKFKARRLSAEIELEQAKEEANKGGRKVIRDPLTEQ